MVDLTTVADSLDRWARSSDVASDLRVILRETVTVLRSHRCAPSAAAPPRADESPGTRLSRESIEAHRAERARGAS